MTKDTYIISRDVKDSLEAQRMAAAMSYEGCDVFSVTYVKKEGFIVFAKVQAVDDFEFVDFCNSVDQHYDAMRKEGRTF